MSEPISRKDFLKEVFGFFRTEVEKESRNIGIAADSFLLPPGAGGQDEFLQTCSQSYQCVSVCPYQAIEVFRNDPQDARYGYPVINPRRQACYLCEDFPCISACKSGALRMERKTIPLGTAVVLKDICFSYKGIYCPSCVVKCPLSGTAISMVDNKPVVQEEECTGCGICVQVCPTEQPAIRIKPSTQNRMEKR